MHQCIACIIELQDAAGRSELRCFVCDKKFDRSEVEK